MNMYLCTKYPNYIYIIQRHCACTYIVPSFNSGFNITTKAKTIFINALLKHFETVTLSKIPIGNPNPEKGISRLKDLFHQRKNYQVH